VIEEAFWAPVDRVPPTEFEFQMVAELALARLDHVVTCPCEWAQSSHLYDLPDGTKAVASHLVSPERQFVSIVYVGPDGEFLNHRSGPLFYDLETPE
jgi:hypothetical protein